MYHLGSGGASRDRTGDLLHAMQALSQLSYGPVQRRRSIGGCFADLKRFFQKTSRYWKSKAAERSASPQHKQPVVAVFGKTAIH